MSISLPGLPERVTVYEVGPRDGLQNESAIIPVETKAEFIQRLVDAGLRTIEATSLSFRPEKSTVPIHSGRSSSLPVSILETKFS